MNRPIVIRNANGQADSPLPAGADAPPTGQLDDAETPRRADPARQQREVPPAGDYLPPEIGLALREDELREWLRAQPPGVRGRMYRLMQGINALFPWPHHILQNEGKFDPLWLTLMMSAAERY